MKSYQLIGLVVASLGLCISCSAENENESSENSPKSEIEELKSVESEAWLELLAGDSLSLWKSPHGDELPEGWSLNEGVLHFKKVPKSRRSDLVMRKDYFNFELKFEFKLAVASNSGLKYRTEGALGLEYQVIDDLDCPDIKKVEHETAAIYDIMKADDQKKLNPAGEWNSARIVADGNRIEHWLNGEKVVATELGSEEWQKYFQKSKYRSKPNFGTSKGPIFIQDHGDEVSYRKVFLKELSR